MGVINRLVDKGNTILIIEHNMDVIKLADYIIIDIGPEGGKGGGQEGKVSEEIIKIRKVIQRSVLKKECFSIQSTQPWLQWHPFTCFFNK
jgi:excinuclease ABC subunit A